MWFANTPCGAAIRELPTEMQSLCLLATARCLAHHKNLWLRPGMDRLFSHLSMLRRTGVIQDVVLYTAAGDATMRYPLFVITALHMATAPAAPAASAATAGDEESGSESGSGPWHVITRCLNTAFLATQGFPMVPMPYTGFDHRKRLDAVTTLFANQAAVTAATGLSGAAAVAEAADVLFFDDKPDTIISSYVKRTDGSPARPVAALARPLGPSAAPYSHINTPLGTPCPPPAATVVGVKPYVHQAPASAATAVLNTLRFILTQEACMLRGSGEAAAAEGLARVVRAVADTEPLIVAEWERAHATAPATAFASPADDDEVQRVFMPQMASWLRRTGAPASSILAFAPPPPHLVTSASSCSAEERRMRGAVASFMASDEEEDGASEVCSRAGSVASGYAGAAAHGGAGSSASAENDGQEDDADMAGWVDSVLSGV